MNIDDFETWFGVNKVISGKEREMEELKELFQECWNNVKESEESSYEIELLEDDVCDLQDKVEKLDGAIADIKDIVSEAKTLKQCKIDVGNYYF